MDRSNSPYKRSLRVFARDWKNLASLGFVLLLVALALFSRFVVTCDPDHQNINKITQSPNLQHYFGTDSLGRDLYSRVIYGSRISMLVAFITAAAGLILGSLYGTVAALGGKQIDTALMRLLDFAYCLPTLLLLILLNMLFGQGLVGIVAAISLEGMCTVARLVRGQVLQLKQMDFVLASLALGSSRSSLFCRHLLPNLIPPLIVTLTFLIPSNIMYEAFLSFIGLGIQPPYSSWGTLANEGWRGMLSHPHLILFPGTAIFVTMLAFHFLGDGIRVAFDPQSER
ncbi:MAG: ABC transporter permease [Deltaproteobacteria bacterium]|nr:ABC transporter permease [Deltaproteobacteria bacterium]